MLFLLSSHLRLILVSVVFDFSASLNDVAPLSPISLSVDLVKMEKKGFVSGCHLCDSFFFMFTTHIEYCECCV